MTLKLKRRASGSYETPDGRFTIVKDPTVAANMWGAFSTPWDLCEGKRDVGCYATLKDARKALEALLARRAKTNEKALDTSEKSHGTG